MVKEERGEATKRRSDEGVERRCAASLSENSAQDGRERQGQASCLPHQKENSAAASRLRVVIVNQYYAPDVASTGHLLHELAQDLASRGFDVGVVTTRPSYGPRETWQKAKLHEYTGGVRIHRLLTTRLSKDHMLGRALNTITFIVPLGVRMLVWSRRDRVYLYTTNPPFLGVIGAFVSLFRRHTYVVLLHDAYPHLATWVGKIRKGGFIERMWHWMNGIAYRRASQTIVLCKAARRLVSETYDVDPSHIHVIPNWADAEKLTPRPKATTDMAREQGLVNPFTVLYSGNLGLYYEFETILGAAEHLRDEQFRLVLVGSGGRKEWIARQIEEQGLHSTCIMLPYQPFSTLNDSLNACDASLVTISRGIEGISFPSKLYSSLAVGKPIIAISEANSELRDLVLEHDLGLWNELGDVEGLTRGIREMMHDSGRVARQGANCRRIFEDRYTRPVAAAHYADVLEMAHPPMHSAAREDAR